MKVHDIEGNPVHLMESNKGVLVDNHGRNWKRTPELDTDQKAAYTTPGEKLPILVGLQELKRACLGTKAMREVTSTDEAEYFVRSLGGDFMTAYASLPRQTIWEWILDSQKRGLSVNAALVVHLRSLIETPEEEDLKEGPEEATEDTSDRGAIQVPPPPPKLKEGQEKAKRRPRRKGDGMEVAGVYLTTKQVEFLERLSENAGWEKDGIEGKYVLGDYTEELNDTMKPMTVGAVAVTLREKGIISMSKSNRICVFWLTEDGKRVYKELSRR